MEFDIEKINADIARFEKFWAEQFGENSLSKEAQIIMKAHEELESEENDNLNFGA